MRSRLVEIPPRTRVEADNGFFSLSYVHVKSLMDARIGIHSPTRRETYLIGGMDWGNIWVYGMEVLLAGYLTREEFFRRASPLHAGGGGFHIIHTRTKKLG